MQKIVLKIYIKNKRSPLCIVDVESQDTFDKLYEMVNNGKQVVKFGQIMFATNEFRYATIEYK